MKMHKFLRLSFLFTIVFLLLSFFNYISFAEEINPASVTEKRAQLQRELEQLESQISGYRETIQEKQRETTTLERDIAILNAQIQKARLEIKARDIRISNLSYGIQTKSTLINSLSEKIESEKASLAEFLRRADENDSTSLIEIVLGYEKLSDFFVDIDDFESIYKAIQTSFDEIKETKNITETEKEQLIEQRSEESQYRTLQELERKRIEQAEAEKKSILKITKGEEKKYQEIIDAKQKNAAKIRSELFMLTGSSAIPFEKAVEYANIAYRATGVRQAFLLGIIAEESNLGQNVGTGNWKTDMHPTRDVPVFKQITAELGLDPDTMPVSKKPWYGWGGAMGPAQFIPSTWILYKDKIAELTGHNPPNPWDPYDAFMASAILLKDNGAKAGNYASERLAALRYFAGWKNATKPAYAFYGDDVMDLASKYQGMIDILNR